MENIDREALLSAPFSYKRPENLIYAVDEKPPFWQLAALSLQQVCILATYLILIVIIGHDGKIEPKIIQNMISVSMVVLGIATVLQAIWKGPVGSGFLVPPVVSAIYLHTSIIAVEEGGLPLLFGMTIVAALCEILFGYLFLFMRHLFPPVVCGLIIIAIGFDLGLIGFAHVFDVKHELSSEQYGLHLFVSFITLAIMVGFTVWGKGVTKLFSVLFGIIVGWIFAEILELIPATHQQALDAASLIGFPHFNDLSYSFNLQLCIPFLICGLAAALRTVGTITTCQRINNANWKHPEMNNIQKGIYADGLGSLIGGLLGISGISASPSAVGVSKFTLATSRYIAFGIAVWFMIFACIPKISALFVSIPLAVMGAVLLYTGSILLASGIEAVMYRPLNPRLTFILGISLFFGLSRKIYPAFFDELPSWLQLFTTTSLSITTLTALLLNALFRINIWKQFDVSIANDQDWGQIDQLLEQNVKKWGAKQSDIKNGATFIKKLTQKLIESGDAEGPIHAKIKYEPQSLIINFEYPGKLINLNPSTMSDETASTIGLSGYLEDIYPDQIIRSSHDGMCRIQCVFDL